MGRIREEGIVFPDVFLDEKNPSGPFTFEIGVGNPLDAPLKAAWTDWVVEPAAGAYSPDPGASWRADFRRKEISKNSSADRRYRVDYDANPFGRLLFTD
ncbi:MAG: hypothetical protein NTW26_10510 [bacterium]|nr:hypothetical protein [bacterium]